MSEGGVISDNPLARHKAGYDLISFDKSDARARRKKAEAERREKMFAGLTFEERQLKIAELAKEKAARKAEQAVADKIRYEDIWRRICMGHGGEERFYTPEEGKWYNAYEDRHGDATGTKKTFQQALREAKPSDLIFRYAQSSRDRIELGYAWEDCLIAGKYWQRAGVYFGLKSDEDPLLKRFVTATAKASSGELRAGPAKDACRPIYRRIIAHDEPYSFFGERCKDMLRIDLDEWFRSSRHLRRWLAKLKRKGKLPFLPHVVVWIRDDRRPGICNPHLYFLLPEGSAVWKDEGQHRTLRQVAAALTEALGGDPGGLSNIFHGKSPLSPHCDYEITNRDSFPTLGEYAKGLTLNYGAKRMARHLGAQQMRSAGFDKSQSNTYWTRISEVANSSRNELARSGFDTKDYQAFLKATAEITAEVMEAEIPEMTWRQREAVEKLVESCSRWAVDHFEKEKLGDQREAGAAAHLMLPTDSPEDRMSKGQAYARGVVVERNCGQISLAIREVLKTGAEPTFSQIKEATGFSLNTVKKHWFPAYTKAAATLSMLVSVRGDSPIRQPIKPSKATLQTAETIAEIPESWRTDSLEDHFRVKALKRARLQRLRKRTSEPIRPRVIIGSNLIDFLSAGVVTVCRPRVPVIRGNADKPTGEPARDPAQNLD